MAAIRQQQLLQQQQQQQQQRQAMFAQQFQGMNAGVNGLPMSMQLSQLSPQQIQHLRQRTAMSHVAVSDPRACQVRSNGRSKTLTHTLLSPGP